MKQLLPYRLNIALLTLSVCLVSVAHAYPCHATNVQVIVHPVRIITIDYHGDIVHVSSNTSLPVTPHVKRVGSDDREEKFTGALKSSYAQLLDQYDFSNPIDITVQQQDFWDIVMNYIYNYV